MSKNIQIRNVPDGVHRKLRMRAAENGRSLSQYLLRELERLTTTASKREMLERLHERTPVRGRFNTAAIIRELRDARR